MLYDETGRAEPRAVDSPRFVVGHGPGCHLILRGAGIIRRHALIESFDGTVRLTPYETQRRTLLNGAAVRAPVELNDGDVITLGDLRRIGVKIEGGAASRSRGRSESAGGGRGDAPAADRAARPQGETGRAAVTRRERTSQLAVALVASVLILSASVCLLFYVQHRRAATPPGGATEIDAAREVAPTRPPDTATAGGAGDAGDVPAATPDTPAPAVGPGESETSQQVKLAAIQVMRRVSSDSQPYHFPENALRDVTRTVEEYRRHAAALRAALLTIRGGGAPLAAQARAAGVAPDMIFYAALAQTDGGRTTQDPLAAARAALPELADLRKPIGSTDADSCLIIVAAYSQRGGSRKPLPLVDQMRQHIKDSYRQRNVWYLHELGVVGAQAYDFVLRFIALGVIAQNPRQYGVDAEPLSF
jgi:hypothetical protein